MSDALLAEVRFHERRRGYDPEEVDRFLRKVGEALTQLNLRLEQARAGERISLGEANDDFAAQLMTVRFRETKGGYDPDEVDSFMAQVAIQVGEIQNKLRLAAEGPDRGNVSSATIFRVIVPVSSIDRAATFYAAVLEVPGERVSPGRHYFDCGGIVLTCFDAVADGDGEKPQRPNPDNVYFSVRDLEAAYQRVERAKPGWLEDEIKVRPWGERSFYAGDPFGNPLCFVAADTTFTGGPW